MKTINFHTLLIIALLAIFSTHLQAQFSGGDGTSGDPYQVATASQLDSLRHFLGSHFVQTANIDLDISPFNTDSGWVPLGTFTGSFDGQGFTIDNLFIDKSASGYVGLFGFVSGATLENLLLTNADITGVGDGCGIIAGWINSTQLNESGVSGTVSCSGKYTGGMVGTLNLSSSITNSYSEATVSGGTNLTGGLVGYMIQSASLDNTYATGSVSGSNSVGGLVGSVSDPGEIDHSYSSGSVNGSTNTGGFTGINNGTITNSFWNTETSGFGSGAASGSTSGITGVTSSEMQTKSTFTDAGWDYFSVWGIETGLNSGFPGLLWQSGYSAPTPEIPDATTTAVSGIESTTATFNGTVNSNNDTTSVRFVYGTTSGVYTDSVDATQSPLIPLGGASDSVSASVTGLAASQTYYVRVAAENSAGYARGEEVSFTTLGSDPPVVTTDAPSSVFRTTVIAAGTVDPNEYSTNVRFLFGTVSGVYTDSVNSTESPITGDNSVSVSAELSGLTANTTYFVRAAAENTIGYVRGEEVSFTTLDLPVLSTEPGTALSFNATSNQAVEISSDSTLDLVDGTIESWIKPDWTPGSLTSNPAIVANRSSSAARFSIHIRNDLSAVDLWNGSSVGTVNYNFSQGEWYHLAWVTDSGTSYLYINGDLIGTTSVVFGSATELPFSIGSSPSDDSFNGLIDEVRIWNVPRTAQDLREEMHKTLAGTESGLVSYWQFNEGTGTSATDSISFNNGVLAESPFWANSTIPVGGGTSASAAGFSSGTASLGKVSLTTTNAFDASVDITATQIDQTPNQLVDEELFLDDRYWAVKAFGTPGTFSTTLTFTVPLSFTGYGTVSNSDFTLYRRNTTSEGNWIVAKTGADSVSDSTISFQGISSFGQFMIGIEPLMLEVSGNEGWRMFSSPVSGVNYGQLLDSLWTQGFTGADFSEGTSNVYTWDESGQQFTSISNASDVPGQGNGFLVYVYDDEDKDGTPDGFPKTMQIDSIQYNGSASPNLSYTDTGNSSNDGWNLVGNPYGSAIDWDASSGLSSSNIDASFYVWSDSANGGSGSYLSWNGLTGTLDNGVIAPWQGFWVKANADSPAITFTDSVRNAGGIFYKPKTPAPQIELTLNGHNGPSKSVVVFSELASFGKDAYDAYKLAPLNTDYLSLASVMDTLEPMDIQALPIEFNFFELELSLEGSNLSDTLRLFWELKTIPEDWTVELIDRTTNERFNAREFSDYEFELTTEAGKQSSATMETVGARLKDVSSGRDKPAPLNSPVQLLKSKKSDDSADSRFALAIAQNTSVSNEPVSELPQVVELQQNYPNPFNPNTTIQFALPNAGTVRLEVFNLLGQTVATLVNERRAAGTHTIRFDASRLASGIYIYRLHVRRSLGAGGRAGKTITKKLTLIK